jgi:hypothetical protein
MQNRYCPYIGKTSQPTMSFWYTRWNNMKMFSNINSFWFTSTTLYRIFICRDFMTRRKVVPIKQWKKLSVTHGKRLFCPNWRNLRCIFSIFLSYIFQLRQIWTTKCINCLKKYFNLSAGEGSNFLKLLAFPHDRFSVLSTNISSKYIWHNLTQPAYWKLI